MRTRADDLASLTVLDERGRSIALGTLWRDRPIVLVFVRHFGCIHCREHAVQLQRDGDKIRAAGADLVMIGNGAPHFIAGFREQTGFTGPIYTDPTLAVYQAAQLERGVTTVLDPRALVPTLKAFARGARPGLTRGDQWQQGGVLVVAPGGEVRWHHISKRPGDNASPAQIVAAL